MSTTTTTTTRDRGDRYGPIELAQSINQAWLPYDELVNRNVHTYLLINLLAKFDGVASDGRCSRMPWDTYRYDRPPDKESLDSDGLLPYKHAAQVISSAIGYMAENLQCVSAVWYRRNSFSRITFSGQTGWVKNDSEIVCSTATC